MTWYLYAEVSGSIRILFYQGTLAEVTALEQTLMRCELPPGTTITKGVIR